MSKNNMGSPLGRCFCTCPSWKDPGPDQGHAGDIISWLSWERPPWRSWWKWLGREAFGSPCSDLPVQSRKRSETKQQCFNPVITSICDANHSGTLSKQANHNMVSIVASQQEGPGLRKTWRLGITLTGHSKLPIGVSVDGCLEILALGWTGDSAFTRRCW